MSAPAAPAVVLAFPARPKDGLQKAEIPGASMATDGLPAAPQSGERPTLVPHALRERLRAALIVSIAVHTIVYLAFQLRFEGDLERAAGAAEALSSEGTITIPVEVLVESVLPSAPSPTNANASDAPEPSTLLQETEIPEDARPEPQLMRIEDLLPPVPEAAPVVLPTAQSLLQLPESPEAAPVVLPTREEAARLALPEEQSAPPLPVETAKTARAPAQAPTTLVIDDKPPLPVARLEIQKTPERPREQKAARSAPSIAAAPSRAASANSNGNAGAGGTLDAGGRAAISSYFARVQAHLLRYRVYPPEARSSGASGVARVIFSLGRDGRVLSVSLAGGSGHGVLDQAAVAMVRRAAPFPPFPSEIATSRLEMGAPIRFDLR